MSKPWTFDAPAGSLKNQLLVDQLYEAASRDSAFAPFMPKWPPLTGYRWLRARFWNFVADWTPHAHFGPCNHDDCY